MRKVGAFEAKTHLSQLLTEVEQTKREIVIQRRGKDVAVLSPCSEHVAREDEEKRDRILAELREVRASQKRSKSRNELKALVEEGRKR